MAHEPAPIDGLLSWLPALALSPLLLAQGVYVRRVTPRLPEAPGSRSGVAGGGPSLKLLILGDSAAAGVGAASQATALAGRLVDELMADFTVNWRLCAESGVTTRDLIARLAGVAGGRFDVAIVSIGVNDVITGGRTRQWTAALASLLDLLESAFGVRHALLSALPPMHRFTALPQPLRWCVGLRARRFNDELLRFAGRDGRCAVVALDYPRDPSYLAPDGFHPGEPAYRHWAAAVAASIRQLPSGQAGEDRPARSSAGRQRGD
jgi:lysophospholipase L1-like esterase